MNVLGSILLIFTIIKSSQGSRIIRGISDKDTPIGNGGDWLCLGSSNPLCVFKREKDLELQRNEEIELQKNAEIELQKHAEIHPLIRRIDDWAMEFAKFITIWETMNSTAWKAMPTLNDSSTFFDNIWENWTPKISHKWIKENNTFIYVDSDDNEVPEPHICDKHTYNSTEKAQIQESYHASTKEMLSELINWGSDIEDSRETIESTIPWLKDHITLRLGICNREIINYDACNQEVVNTTNLYLHIHKLGQVMIEARIAEGLPLVQNITQKINVYKSEFRTKLEKEKAQFFCCKHENSKNPALAEKQWCTKNNQSLSTTIQPPVQLQQSNNSNYIYINADN